MQRYLGVETKDGKVQTINPAENMVPIFFYFSVNCKLKKIVHSYHTHCISCATGKKICAKCHESTEIVDPLQKSVAELAKEEQERQFLVDSLTERQRRSYNRKMENGDLEGALQILELNANLDNLEDDYESDFGSDD